MRSPQTPEPSGRELLHPSERPRPLSDRAVRLRYRLFGIWAVLYLAAVTYAIWFAFKHSSDKFAGFLGILLTLPTSLVAGLMTPGGLIWGAAMIGISALINVWLVYLIVKRSTRRGGPTYPTNVTQKVGFEQSAQSDAENE